MKLILILTLICFIAAAKADDKHEDPEHAHGRESLVGPDKGLTEVSEQGFKISPQALKTFELQIVPVQENIIEIPAQALVKIKDTKSIFRFRDNWYKRVDVTIVQKKSNTFIVKSNDLKTHDHIVTNGVGFLRTAEVFSHEGATHSH